jgi:catechol 2,3-dioxygenase-like lactoylglutathione lyase family enzyme
VGREKFDVRSKANVNVVAARRALSLVAATVALFLFPTASSLHTSSASASTLTLPVTAVDSIGITVSDMDRAVDFYTRVLTFERVSDVEVAGREYELLEGVFGARLRVVRLRLGDEFLELTEYLAPKGRPVPADLRPNDRSFQHAAIIVSDMDAAYRRLRAHGVEHASTGPQRLPDWNVNAGGISAFYFRDPDRHFLEILHFPAGKGLDKWHRSDRLFLGIDHTAIVVGDTDQTLRLYRDAFQMRVAGESENYDTEQEHLNNVFGARLRITAIRAAQGPGIELLEYLAPRDGRPAPSDLHANDITHWQTTLLTGAPEAINGLLRQRIFSLVSPDVVRLPTAAVGLSRAVLIRDADGHGLRIGER